MDSGGVVVDLAGHDDRTPVSRGEFGTVAVPKILNTTAIRLVSVSRQEGADSRWQI